jgi:nicotinamidase-related amidase
MAAPAAISSQNFIDASRPFVDWVVEWYNNLPTLDLEAYMRENRVKPENLGLISADLVVGFCYEGPLASPRIAGVVDAAARVMQRAYALGAREFALVQEYHTHDAPEFEQFAPHCIRGTHEADTVEALKALPFSESFAVIRKNSLHPALHTDMDAWIAERPNLNTFIAVGDCTDLCLYQLVMHLKMNANAAGQRVNVIVPDDCVQTYNLPVDVAKQIGAMPHNGDLIHLLFLYHMALNGATVVRNVV